MIRINLLPFRTERKKENVRRQVSLFLLSLILVLIVLVYYNFNLSSKIGNLNKKIADTKTDLNRYNEINQEIAKIKKNLEILRKKMAVIEQLESDRHAPVQLLDTMTQLLFSNVNLKTLKREEVQKSNLKSFQIVCTKTPPQIQKAKKG